MEVVLGYSEGSLTWEGEVGAHVPWGEGPL